jgi:hypothetical protein
MYSIAERFGCRWEKAGDKITIEIDVPWNITGFYATRNGA